VSAAKPAGFLSFTLHAHLPYVVNHGTWPHGIEWLHEAAAETYLPLLRVLASLERDGIPLRCNLNLSPILLEQLAHPVFQAEFPRYLERKVAAAREDEAYFLSNNEPHYAATARHWQHFFTLALDQFESLDRRIHDGFRAFHEKGAIEIITCAATHGYMPLLGTDESLRAQVRVAIASHQRHLGLTPRGMWAPECGYRPAGQWAWPVSHRDGAPLGPPFARIGVEQALGESGIDFFLVDTHLVEASAARISPYRLPFSPGFQQSARPATEPIRQQAEAPHRRLYQPYFVEGPFRRRAAVAVFPRDPQTGLQVWSGENGYPGDPLYLDFHKKRWPGGHRYWRVTGPNVDMGSKEPYDPAAAAERIQSHASHFVDLVWKTLHPSFDDTVPPILSSPFDAELFGHWWFEGPQWLEQVARTLHDYPTGIELISGSAFLDRYKPNALIAMPEGSWGAEGNNQVWLNPDTAWTYTELYECERDVRTLATAGHRPAHDPHAAVHLRILQQLCRELLLLESSDWQFLITTGAARDYAELRFRTHRSQFDELRSMIRTLDNNTPLSEDEQQRLSAIEERDSIFPGIDPALWAEGAHATPAREHPATGDLPRLEPGATSEPMHDATLSELHKFFPHGDA
jgi:1,4-alpha-glucan branching enzyme